jgi:hypothetical protein
MRVDRTVTDWDWIPEPGHKRQGLRVRRLTKRGIRLKAVLTQMRNHKQQTTTSFVGTMLVFLVLDKLRKALN